MTLDATQVRAPLGNMSRTQLCVTFLAAVALLGPAEAHPQRRRDRAGSPGGQGQVGGARTRMARASTSPSAGKDVMQAPATTPDEACHNQLHRRMPPRQNKHPNHQPARHEAGHACRLHTFDKHERSQIKRSLAQPGDASGDRFAEYIVTRLPGWPRDTALQIVQRESHGGWKMVRSYPEGGSSRRAIKLGVDNGVYVAVEGSDRLPPAPSNRPPGDQGNTFYWALGQALNAGQRTDMGLTSAADDVGRLRKAVSAFARVRENWKLMNPLFIAAGCDHEWLESLRQARRKPLANVPTPPPAAIAREGTGPCSPERILTISTTGNPRAWFVFHIHVHDDIPRNMDATVARRFDWWWREMSDLLPEGTGLQLRIQRDEPGLTDIDYASDRDGKRYKAVDNLKTAIALDRSCATGGPMSRNYHLLLTNDDPYPGLLGVALGRIGVASVHDPVAAGHELGHMVGATHEDGAVAAMDDSTPCATAMREAKASPRPLPYCERYSDSSRESIRRNLAAIWRGVQAKLAGSRDAQGSA